MKRIGILREATSNILQKMFFMIEQPEPEEYVENYHYYAEIDDKSYRIIILFSKKITKELASNFLGVETKIPEKEILDCLREVINMIAGNFIGSCNIKQDKLISIPVSNKTNLLKANEKEYEKEILFYLGQPLKILYKEK